VACFNNLYKVTPDTFAAWMEILKAVPAAVLWLLRMPGAAVPRLLAEMQAAGVSQGRLITSDLFPREVHLQVKSAATVFLDTLAYNAHSSAADSLAAGVPVVTCAGAAMPSRVAASLVIAANMHVTLARSKEDYVLLALQGLDRGGRVARQWRARLVQQRKLCPFLDRDNWARGFAALLKLAAVVSASDMPPFHMIPHSNTLGLS
jgi:protein O-GlcNAc transferase